MVIVDRLLVTGLVLGLVVVLKISLVVVMEVGLVAVLKVGLVAVLKIGLKAGLDIGLMKTGLKIGYIVLKVGLNNRLRLASLNFLIGFKLIKLARLAGFTVLLRQDGDGHLRGLLRLLLGSPTTRAWTASDWVRCWIDLARVVRASSIRLTLVLGTTKALKVLSVFC